jgi:hypothetical protein
VLVIDSNSITGSGLMVRGVIPPNCVASRSIWPGMVEAAPISAAIEGCYNSGKHEGYWETAYGIFDLPVPDERVKLARAGAGSPYFNAGAVAFPIGFGKCWLEAAQELDRNVHGLWDRRPWLDQIALPVAMHRAGLHHKHLDNRFNFSTTHRPLKETMPKNLKAKLRKEIDRLNGAAPFLIHYHAPGSMRDLRYDGYVDDLLREFTVFECMEDLDWRKYLHFDAKADGRVLGFEEDTWKEADPRAASIVCSRSGAQAPHQVRQPQSRQIHRCLAHLDPARCSTPKKGRIDATWPVAARDPTPISKISNEGLSAFG